MNVCSRAPIALAAALVMTALMMTALGAAPSFAGDHSTYVLNTSTAEPYATPERTGFLDKVVAEAFRRIGLKGEVAIYEASKRALINANDDVDQGVAMRVLNLEKEYPNLVRIPEKVIDNDFVAYSKNIDVATTDWNALKPYSVTHIHGWVVFERNLVEGQAVTAVKEPRQMFSMLDSGRVDMALYERWQGLYRAKAHGAQVRVHEPPLASVEMFMYVHKSHQDLVEPLAKALRGMKADGAYQAIFDETLSSLAR